MDQHRPSALGIMVGIGKPPSGAMDGKAPMMPNKKSDAEPVDPDLVTCAKMAMHYVRTNDPEGFARALKHAFTILDSGPHEEGPHEDEQMKARGGEVAPRHPYAKDLYGH